MMLPIFSKQNNSEHFLNLFFSKFHHEPDFYSFIFGFHGDVNIDPGVASLHRVDDDNATDVLKAHAASSFRVEISHYSYCDLEDARRIYFRNVGKTAQINMAQRPKSTVNVGRFLCVSVSRQHLIFLTNQMI
jgi:hypothetical protein